MFIDSLERGREGKRETLAASHIHCHRIEPAAWVCALMGKPTLNFWMYNQLSHLARSYLCNQNVSGASDRGTRGLKILALAGVLQGMSVGLHTSGTRLVCGPGF